MGALFGRTCTLTLGTTQIKCAQFAGAGANTPAGPEQSGGLAITFRVKKNLKAEPNSVEIKVWNLSPATRLSLENPSKSAAVTGSALPLVPGSGVAPATVIPVQLDVGYGGDNHTIFIGQLRNATSEINGPNIITTVSSGDNEQAFAAQRVKFTIPAQATPQQILATAAQGLGVGMGNVGQQLGGATAGTGGPARVVMGAAAKVFGQQARSNGLQWSVQDGALQVLPIGQSLGGPSTAVLLNAQSGLVGSPTIDNKGIVKCESLIQPGLTPGLPLVLESANLKGAFRIEDVEFNGATWGAPWTATIHARKWK